MEDNSRYFRLISNGVRFGYGFQMNLDSKQFFAWHGSPKGNDDYITTTAISEEEYEQIGMEYPDDIVADIETADISINFSHFL